MIKSSFAGIETDIQLSLDRINKVYRELSAHNLDPQTTLYTVTDPVVVKKPWAISLRKTGMAGILLLLMTLMITPIFCLIRHRFNEETNIS